MTIQEDNGNQFSIQLNKVYKLFVEDIMIILMLSALWFYICSNVLLSRGQCGVFHIKQSLSESLWTSIASKRWSFCEHFYCCNCRRVTFIMNFNYINSKIEESTLVVLNVDLNSSFKLFHKLGSFIKWKRTLYFLCLFQNTFSQKHSI